MKRFARALLVLAALMGIAFVATWPVVQSFAQRSRLAQRVQIDPAADALFGSEPTPIGSPQLLIIDDPKAFVGNEAKDGVWQVDEAYLQKQGVYPLQLQTVNYVAGLVRLGTGLGALILAGLAGLLSRRADRRSVDPTHAAMI